MPHYHQSFTFRIYLIAALFIVLFQPTILAQPHSATSTLPSPNWTRSHDYDVQHYRIQISFDWKQKSVAGETTITLRPFLSNFRELELDAGEMVIQSVVLEAGNKAKKLDFRYDGKEKLRVALDRPYRASEEVKVSITYSAQPRRGLTFITPNENDPERPYQIWSQGEAETNHYWFPCYDYPNDFATTETIVTVEDKYQVIGNGTLLGVKRDSARKTATYHWKMNEPHATYLTSIIVGEFAEIKQDYAGIPIISYVPKDRLGDARLSFNKIAEMMRFFSEKTGVKYPFVKYAQTAVRGYPGGMENISATTLGDAFIYDERALLDQSADELLAHELAHQWFGDLVTCRDWSEIWLNEGFATYFEHLFTEHDRGRDEMLYGVLGNQRQYFSAWTQGNRQPIINNRYNDPDSVFGVYAYPRAGAVLHMLRMLLGDEAWWKAVNHYLITNRHKNVETAQLKIAIEEATGQNLGWFFDQWAFRMGHPELTVSFTYDEAAKTVRLKVQQTQKTVEKSAYPVVEVFRLPIDIGITTASGERITRIWVEKAESEFTLPVDSKPLIVNFDRGNALIKELKFEKPQEDLIYQATHDVDAMGRLWAVNELKKFKSDEVAQALGKVLAKDTFWGVKVEAAKVLAGFKTDASKIAFMAGAKDAKSRVRREAIGGLGQFKDAALAPLFIEVIERDQSYYTVASAARALAASRAPQAYDVLIKLLDRPSDKGVIRAGALDGLAQLGDVRAVDLAFRYAVAPNPEAVRISAMRAALMLGRNDAARHEQLFNLFASALKPDAGLSLPFVGLTGLAQLGDPRAIPVIEAAMKDIDLGPATPFLKQQAQGVIAQLKSRATQKTDKD